MLSVVYAECRKKAHYAECHCADGHLADGRSAFRFIAMLIHEEIDISKSIKRQE